MCLGIPYRMGLHAVAVVANKWPAVPQNTAASLQEILRRDDVVRTSCNGPNDVIFRRRDDVES